MKELAQVLRGLPSAGGDRVLVGPETFDDAGVFRLNADLALVQTVDFFPPMLDDASLFGQIAAANSLSDVYAMGGTPLTALSLVCFPAGLLSLDTLGEILRGAAEKCAEAGCTIVGGHSVTDTEIKFGLAVTGTIHPERIAKNSGARAGDRLFLTKPLGIGALTVAYRNGTLSAERMRQAGEQMAQLNRGAAEAMSALGINAADGVHAATDITGYGLLGHARNIAEASGVTLTFRAAALPVCADSLACASRGELTGMARKNEELLAGLVDLAPGLDENLRRVIHDAETSGGLLIAVAPESAARFAEELARRGVATRAEIGEVEPRGAQPLRVTA